MGSRPDNVVKEGVEVWVEIMVWGKGGIERTPLDDKDARYFSRGNKPRRTRKYLAMNILAGNESRHGLPRFLIRKGRGKKF